MLESLGLKNHARKTAASGARRPATITAVAFPVLVISREE